MYCFVILLLFNEMQMSVRRFSVIPHLRTRFCLREEKYRQLRRLLNKVTEKRNYFYPQ